MPPARFTSRRGVLDGAVPVLVARTGYTGEDGVEICAAPPMRRRSGGCCSRFPRSRRRVSAPATRCASRWATTSTASDMDRAVDPISAGLGWVCPKDKAGYIGAETVAACARAGPVARSSSHLSVEGGIPRHGFTVLHEGERGG